MEAILETCNDAVFKISLTVRDGKSTACLVDLSNDLEITCTLVTWKKTFLIVSRSLIWQEKV